MYRVSVNFFYALRWLLSKQKKILQLLINAG